MYDETAVSSMLNTIKSKVGVTLTLTFAGGATVSGVLTEGSPLPDDYHRGVQRYLVGTAGAVIQPNWSAVVAISYPGS